MVLCRSRMNAYINAGVYVNWAFSRYFDLIVGGDFTHFSNGNTKYPNAGNQYYRS